MDISRQYFRVDQYQGLSDPTKEALKLLATHASTIFPWAHPETEWTLQYWQAPEFSLKFHIHVHPAIDLFIGVSIETIRVLGEVWLNHKTIFEIDGVAEDADVIGLLSTAAAEIRLLIANHPDKFQCYLSHQQFNMELHPEGGLLTIHREELVWMNPMKSGIFQANKKIWNHPLGNIGDFQHSFYTSFGDSLGAPWSTKDWSPMELG